MPSIILIVNLYKQHKEDALDKLFWLAKTAIPTNPNQTIQEQPKEQALFDIFPSQSAYKLTAQHYIESRPAEFSDQPLSFHPSILPNLHIKHFYKHQHTSLAAILSGSSCMIATPTSSGKSLVYQLAVLNSLLHSQDSKSLFIYPTKALAADQKRSFVNLLDRFDELKLFLVDCYDGDIESNNRRAIRENSSVVFTNPEMLHLSLTTQHALWSEFLKNLKFLVVDGKIHFII